ncbi:chorismate-binding protein [Dyadobacter psychrotolerans]|uniref:isochorismate synthase n=1 Tax=Dyadobacter psychrotolerans TaxID=2541721 RepID=A0A4R5DPK1_9BACT|nr:chorismate-binding protein [Dyadobacter psychrotolerans]TDE16179.1 isochorismate synthase [Dyadobacter psychrotolerans]
MVSVQTGSKTSIFEGLKTENLWEASKTLGFPAALWRLPYTNEIKILISIQDAISKIQPDFEKLPCGFLMGSFDWQENEPVNFMEGDIIVTFGENNQAVQTSNRLGEEHPDVKRLVALSWEIQEKTVYRRAGEHALSGVLLTDERSKERFKRTVELAVAAISHNQFKKVVLSRTKEIQYNDDFQPAKAFSKLAKAYPHAFVSLVNLAEQNELWLGASPETLVEQKSNGTFKTMALAGTQKARNSEGDLIPKYDVRWGQKEIEEHALVSRYIVECFKKIRLREYSETGPKTVLAGNVYHLRTEFDVDTIALNFSELPTTMLKLLHPTSAICGEPKLPSLKFIQEVEGYDRSFYSGFLGPVQVEGESNIFVNLRTVRLKNGVATLFAGAGITEDSVPEQEWQETELKCDTLLKVIAEDFIN